MELTDLFWLAIPVVLIGYLALTAWMLRGMEQECEDNDEHQ